MCAWRRMLRGVPTAISDLCGKMAVSTISPVRRTNFTWLPRWLASLNPAASSRRLTSRNGSGLSRPNLYLNGVDLRWPRRHWRLEMEFQRFFQIDERFLFRQPLAGDIDFETLGDLPLALSPHRCRKWPFHSGILSPFTAAASHSPARSSPLRAGSLRRPPPGRRLPGSAASRPGSTGPPRAPCWCQCG